MKYLIIHTVSSAESEHESAKLAAARALYAELLKYFSGKAAEKSA